MENRPIPIIADDRERHSELLARLGHDDQFELIVLNESPLLLGHQALSVPATTDRSEIKINLSPFPVLFQCFSM